MNNIKKLSKNGMILLATSLILMGFINFYTVYEVPSLSELQKYTGTVSRYYCNKTKRGDRLSFDYVNKSKRVIVRKVNLNCNVIHSKMVKSQKVTVWLDLNLGYPTAYAIKIGDLELYSPELGIRGKDVSLLGLLMIVFGSILMFKSSKIEVR